jgi:hypothetical protein
LYAGCTLCGWCFDLYQNTNIIHQVMDLDS